MCYLYLSRARIHSVAFRGNGIHLEFISTHTLGNERITFSSARACEVTKADFRREARIEKLDFFLISAIAQTIAAARDNYSIRSAIVADGRISMRGWNRFALKSHDAICEYGARHSRYSIHGASRVYCARRRRLSREVSQIHRLHLQPCKKVGKKDRVRSPRHLNLPNCFGAPYEVTYARINRWQLGNHTNITASLFPREICIYRPKTAFNWILNVVHTSCREIRYPSSDILSRQFKMLNEPETTVNSRDRSFQNCYCYQNVSGLRMPPLKF